MVVYSFFCVLPSYNSLPLHLRHAENADIFKRNLKTFIFSEEYDTETGIVKDDFTT